VLVTGSLQDNLIKNIENKLCNVSKKIIFATTAFVSEGDHTMMLSNKKLFRKVVLNFLRENTLVLGDSR